jgi:hypothetical protein
MGEVRKVFLCLFGIVALCGIVYYLLNRPVVDHDVAVAGNARLTILKWVGIVFLCAIAFLVMAALRYLCFRWQHHVRREEAKTKKLEEEARIAKETANSIQGEAKQKNAVGDRAYGMIPYLLRLQATMTVREEGFTPYLIGREHALTETAWQGVWSAQLDNERKRLELPYVSRSENEWVQDLREPLGTRPFLANYRSAKEPPPQLVPPEANFMPPKLDLYTILAQEGFRPNESGIFLARGSINNSVIIPPRTIRHLIGAGPTGGGKSNLMRDIIA